MNTPSQPPVANPFMLQTSPNAGAPVVKTPEAGQPIYKGIGDDNGTSH
jgi:hypothetical protein